MEDAQKTKTQLIAELSTLRQQLRERHVQESRRTQDQDRLHFLLSTNPAVAYTREPKGDLTATFVSDNIAAQFGYDPQEVLGDPGFWVDRVHPEDAPRVFAELPCLFVHGQHSYEYRFRLKDGTYRWMRDEFRLVRDAAGNPVEVVGSWLDITARKRAEDALRESEERYRALFEHALIGVFRSTPAARFIEVNPALVRMLGYHSAEEVLALTLPEALYVDPRQRKRLQDSYHATGAITGVELLWKKKDGRHIVVSLYARAIHDGQGDVVAYEGIVLDITERKQAETALRKSEQRLRTMVEHLPAGAIYRDGEFLFFNKAVETITGYANSDIPTIDHWFTTLYEEEAEAVRGWYEQDRAAHFPHSRTAPINRKDGQRRFVEFAGYRDESGEVWLLYDVTARQQAEDALRESEERYRSVITALEEGIVVQAADGAIHAWNASAERILGLSAAQLRDRTSLDPRWRAIHEDGSPFPGEQHPSMVTLRTGAPCSNVIMGVHKPEGTLTWISIHTQPLFRNNESTPYASVSSFTDITARKQEEEKRQRLQEQLFQAKKLEAIGALAGGVAHDFNNILSAVVGYTELAKDEAPTGSVARRNLEEVLKASRRAKMLVRQILTFSRADQQERSPVRLHQIVEETLALLQASSPRTITIDKDIADTAEPMLANPTQMQQMVMNLCVNALQAMEQQEGRLTVSLKRVELNPATSDIPPTLTSGPYLKLLVSDTGCGMDAKVREHIFEPFFTTKPVGRGTGLGLSIVHGIVTDLGGAIEVESQPGRGAAFQVYLPLRENDISAESS